MANFDQIANDDLASFLRQAAEAELSLDAEFAVGQDPFVGRNESVVQDSYRAQTNTSFDDDNWVPDIRLAAAKIRRRRSRSHGRRAGRTAGRRTERAAGRRTGDVGAKVFDAFLATAIVGLVTGSIVSAFV